MADGITIDATAVKRLQDQLKEFEKRVLDQRKFYKQSGTYMIKEIKLRFRNQGPNVMGQKWTPILAISAAARRHAPAGAKKIASADRKDGRTSRALGATAYPQAKLFQTSRGAVVDMKSDKYGAVVYPLQKIPKGKMSGEPVLLPHHPPSLTGHARTGRPPSPLPDRSSFYFSARDYEEIPAMGLRQIDKEMDKLVNKLR